MIKEVEITLDNGKVVNIAKDWEDDSFHLKVGNCVVFHCETVAEVLEYAIKLYE